MILESDDFLENDREPIQSDYCTINFCTQKSTGRKCVQKQFPHKEKGEPMRKSYRHAIRILSKVDHPAIVPFIGYYEKDNSVFLIEEEIEKGNLSGIISNIIENGDRDPLWDDTHKLIISNGISCAMEYLHKKLIIHREICPDNILLDSELHPYLADFQLSMKAKLIHDREQIVSAISPLYAAPEYLINPFSASSTSKLDVYSYGMTVYSIITELFPFNNCKNKSKVLQDVIHDVRPALPEDVPSHWKELITNCWKKDPKERPTFTEICDTLESDDFMNGSISRHVFENYKRAVKPLRSSD